MWLRARPRSAPAPPPSAANAATAATATPPNPQPAEAEEGEPGPPSGGGGRAEGCGWPTQRQRRLLLLPLLCVGGILLVAGTAGTTSGSDAASISASVSSASSGPILSDPVREVRAVREDPGPPRGGGEGGVGAPLPHDPACAWRNDSLVGTCFGLRCGDSQPGSRARNAKQCSSICCSMGNKCISWQYREDIGCCTGPVVRLGHEGSRSPHWCEPTPPSPWLGKRKAKGTSHTNGICEWKPEDLKGQCFGLGPEKPPKTVEACREACCTDLECEMWQFRKDKGCFYGKSNSCHGFEEIQMRPFIGARKPVDSKLYRVTRDGWLERRKN